MIPQRQNASCKFDCVVFDKDISRLWFPRLLFEANRELFEVQSSFRVP